VSSSGGRTGSIVAFVLLTVVPFLLAAASTVLGLLAAGDPITAPVYRFWAIVSAIVLAVLLIVKGVRDYAWGITLQDTRYNTLRELHDRIGPALDLMTEMALLDTSDVESRRLILRTIASNCCSALVAMTPESKDVRAVVFELRPPEEIAPLAHFGRSDAPRTFSLAEPDGREILEYLESGRDEGELYPRIRKQAPPFYDGDTGRYNTFIRTPIRGNGVVFGMLTVDATKVRSLKKGDVRLAELIAAELGTAFAIAAT
jgi:hypothetical protein